jgi:hypothetical protein
VLFIEKASGLLNDHGVLGFIVPSYWISRSQTERLRSHLCGTLWPETLNETYSAGVLLDAIRKPDQKHHLFYLMGLLNSKAVNYWYRKCVLDVSIRVVDLARVPIPTIDFSDRKDRTRHDRMVQLVEGILSLHERLASMRTEHDKTVLDRQIENTDRQIDQLVYDLYGLTSDEIRLVEETTV